MVISRRPRHEGPPLETETTMEPSGAADLLDEILNSPEAASPESETVMVSWELLRGLQQWISTLESGR